MKHLLRFIIVAVLLVISVGTVQAVNVPANFRHVEVASGYTSPTAMEFAPDGRLFVLEQGGAVRIIKNGQKLDTPFLEMSVDKVGERGLLGIAFDPDFATNNHVYLYHTVPGDGSKAPRNRITRVTANGDVELPGSRQTVITLDDLSGATNHNGGAIHFGKDGKLYVAVGDNANPAFAQSLDTRHGKMLRINKDGSIPTDNPFYTQTDGANRMIWAWGLRNPFTFAFQPGTGRMYINDVGHVDAAAREEINEGIAGANYGYPDSQGDTTNPAHTSPVYNYPHNNGACAITGGAFYNPATSQYPPDYVGDYFFADYCADWIYRYDLGSDDATQFAAETTGSVVDLKVGPDGFLYYLARGDGGKVYRFEYSTNQEPQITQQPQDVTVAMAQNAGFTCVASGAAPLTYKWQRNGVDIPNTNTTTYSFTPSSGDNGAQYRCVVSNSLGTVTSNAATLTILNTLAPVAVIDLPVEGSKYNAGDVLRFEGSATDPEDGTLPASAFTWWIDFHHDDHTHPALAPTSGIQSGEYPIPTEGEVSANVWYRVYLKVTDSAGASTTVWREVFPNKVSLTVNTNPPGIDVTVDDIPVASPVVTESVVGVKRIIAAPASVTIGDTFYLFDNWSNGGARRQIIDTPNADTTYTANYIAAASTELLANGGFETMRQNNPRMPAKWSMQNGAGEKMQCKPEHTHGGECAFRFKGGKGNPRALLTQKVEGAIIAAGDQLVLELYAKTKAPKQLVAKAQIKVKYAGGGKGKAVILLPAAEYAYQRFTELLITEGAVNKVKVKVQHVGKAGKLWIDDLSLKHVQGAGTSTTAPATTLMLP